MKTDNIQKLAKHLTIDSGQTRPVAIPPLLAHEAVKELRVMLGESPLDITDTAFNHATTAIVDAQTRIIEEQRHIDEMKRSLIHAYCPVKKGDVVRANNGDDMTVVKVWVRSVEPGIIVFSLGGKAVHDPLVLLESHCVIDSVDHELDEVNV